MADPEMEELDRLHSAIVEKSEGQIQQRIKEKCEYILGGAEIIKGRRGDFRV